MGSLFDDIADDPVPFPSQANPQPEGAPSPAQFARAPQSQEDSAQSTDDGISSYVPNYLKESARSLYEGPRERLRGLAGEFQNSRLSGQTAAGICALLDPIPAVSQGTANAGSIADAANRVYNDYRNAIMGTQDSAPFKYSEAEDAQKERFARENPETAQTIGAVMEGQLSHPYGVMGAPRDVAPIAERTGKAIAENAPDATQLNSLGGPKAKTSLGSLFADIPDEPPHDTDPLGYYSAALEAANSLKQAKGTPEQMLAQLKKGGAKDAEIEATGLDKWIASRGGMDVNGALKSGQYLVRGARDGTLRLGNEGGLWATDSAALAKTFGDRLELVPKPEHVFNADYFSIGDIIGIDPDEGVHASELSADEWAQIRTKLAHEGYDAVNFGAGHMDGANDIWLLRDDVPRTPAVEGKGTVTRDEIVNHLEENRVGLNEVNRRIRDDAMTPTERATMEAKWAPYSLDPNNPSYRETVLHLPNVAGDKAEAAYLQYNREVQEKYGRPSAAPAEVRQRLSELNDARYQKSGDVFQSGHFQEPNITGHMMTSLVKDAEGKPVFLLDQIQSDWGQRLRDAGGARDEAKIAGLRKKSSDAANEFEVLLDQGRKLLGRNSASYWDTVEAIAKSKDDNAIALGHKLADAHSTSMLLNAELRTAEETPSGHPLVNTTSQWVTTTLRRAINQAIEAGADKIAIPSGDTVLSYNPGDEHGMNDFYNKIVPLALKKIMRGHDVAYPEPARVEKLETPTKGAAGEGFTVFPITDAVKESAKRGQPLFARGGRVRKSASPAVGGKIRTYTPSSYVQGLVRKYAPPH